MIDTKEIRKALAIHGVDALNVDEVLDVLDHLEAAYKEIESWKGLARQFGNEADELRTHLSFAKDELRRLHAQVEQARADDEVIFIDGVGAVRSGIKSCRDGVQWIRVGDRIYWPLSDSDAKRLQSACCGKGSFSGPTSLADEGEHQ